MDNPIFPAGLLSSAQFDEYTGRWLAVVGEASSDALAQSFQFEDQRLLRLRLPIERVVMLLSTVGVQQIKARFLLLPDEAVAGGRFAVALYATDAEEERLSACYLADDGATDATALPETDGGIPTSLAAIWLAGWAATATITPALFATGAGPLRGYNFKVSDFINPLLDNQSFDDLELHLNFGLSEYYAADQTLTQTFGLLLRVYNTKQHAGSGYEDMIAPCPPGR